MRAVDDVTDVTCASEISSGSSGGVAVSAYERATWGTTSVVGGALCGAFVRLGFGAAARTWTSGVCFVGTRVNGWTRGVGVVTGVTATGRSRPFTRTSGCAGESVRWGPAATDAAGRA